MILLTGRKKIKNNQKAFTFIEIILVVLIVAIIAGLAVPNFSKTYAAIELKGCAQDLAYLMRYAQSRAITQNHTLQLQWSPDFSQYSLMQENEAVKDAAFVPLDGKMGRSFLIPKGITLTSTKAVISFYPDGNIDEEAMEICQEKRCLTVSTKIQNGYVRVFDARAVNP